MRIAAIAAGVCLLGIGAIAQVGITPRPKSPAPGAPQTGRSNIRVDSHLVLVPVTVNDDFNRPITGLEKDNFRIFEDKAAQPIAAFSSEDEPIALGFIFDTSGSMQYTIPEGRHAAAEFLKLADPKDEFFLVEFNDRPRLTVPLTADTGHIGTEVLFTKSAGSTALIDALYIGINEMRKSKKGKKALVLISDDGENNSRYTPTEIRRIVRESDVLIYSVVVGGAGGGADQQAGQGLMKGISETSGAHVFYAGAGNLVDIAEKICIELRNRYLLAYVPPDAPRDGRYHRIEVRVVPPGDCGSSGRTGASGTMRLRTKELGGRRAISRTSGLTRFPVDESPQKYTATLRHTRQSASEPTSCSRSTVDACVELQT